MKMSIVTRKVIFATHRNKFRIILHFSFLHQYHFQQTILPYTFRVQEVVVEELVVVVPAPELDVVHHVLEQMPSPSNLPT